MGRPPCCDKVGIKKGPWTPEEDIILVSYIQEHGPGNWRSVPTNTGLLRCSKSCRLRWTNYLRPGIKRGNFTAHEEGMIIHLQALLGNKWAAIASYLPQRTDNDIKNYWNTHLKKKLNKFQAASEAQMAATQTNQNHNQFVGKSFNLDFTSSRPASSTNTRLVLLDSNNNNNQNSSTATYASSTENISRLLEGWMRASPKLKTSINNGGRAKQEEEEEGGNLISDDQEEFQTILSFDHHHHMNNVVAWDYNKCTSDSTTKGSGNEDEKGNTTSSSSPDRKQIISDHNNPPLSFLEKWLLEETSTAQVEEIMQLPPIF